MIRPLTCVAYGAYINERVNVFRVHFPAWSVCQTEATV